MCIYILERKYFYQYIGDTYRASNYFQTSLFQQHNYVVSTAHQANFSMCKQTPTNSGLGIFSSAHLGPSSVKAVRLGTPLLVYVYIVCINVCVCACVTVYTKLSLYKCLFYV